MYLFLLVRSDRDVASRRFFFGAQKPRANLGDSREDEEDEEDENVVPAEAKRLNFTLTEKEFRGLSADPRTERWSTRR
jgi:hypothetical protein